MLLDKLRKINIRSKCCNSKTITFSVEIHKLNSCVDDVEMGSVLVNELLSKKKNSINLDVLPPTFRQSIDKSNNPTLL